MSKDGASEGLRTALGRLVGGDGVMVTQGSILLRQRGKPRHSGAKCHEASDLI